MKVKGMGLIYDIKEFSVHDGPGIRATVFLKGCPLRCLWCHNPEGISPEPQLMISQNGCTDCKKCMEPCDHGECEGFGRCAAVCPYGLIRIAGKWMTAEDIAERMLEISPLLVNGGVTISGGEPLMQPEFLLELLHHLRSVHTVVESSGYAREDVFRKVVKACSILYLDMKHSDSRRHQLLTGVDNERILQNLTWLKKQSKPFVVRIPLIPGCNDDEENLKQTAVHLENAQALQKVELLAMNPFAEVKYRLLQEPFPLAERKDFLSGKASAENPVQIFREHGISCRMLK